MKLAKAQILLLLLVFTQLATSECDKGCLKCTTQGLCTLCDYTNKFRLIENHCVQNGTENCKSFSVSGTCLSCI